MYVYFASEANSPKVWLKEYQCQQISNCLKIDSFKAQLREF